MTSRTAMPLDYSRLDGSAFSRERLQTLSVVVIGAGALGNEVVKALGLLGAGAATLIDFDRVEPSDLTRSTLLRDRRFAGAYKAESLAEAAGGLFPDTDFGALSCPVADVGLGALERAALWFSCVDNDAARLEIAYLSTKLDRPVVDGGLGGTRSSHGRVTWFPGRAGACCGCRLRPSVRREILSSWTSDRLSCTRPATATGEVLPSTPTMAAIVGSMQVEIGLGRLFGSEPGQALSIEITLAPEAKLEEIEIPRSADCLFHEPAGELIAWPQDRPFTELLEGRGNGAAVALDWPVCLEARCAACDHEWRPYGRAALVARTPCPACSAQKAYASESLEAIRPGSEWAARTGATFGCRTTTCTLWCRNLPPGKPLLRSLIIGTAIGAFMAVVQLLAALVSPEVAIGGGLAVGLLSVGIAKFFRAEFENRWAIMLAALLGSVAGIGLALAAGVAGPPWMLALAPPLALLGAGVLQISKGGGGKRCGLCERRVSGPRFDCPRCGLCVGEQCCWVHERLRCRLCEQNEVPAFPADGRWWDRNFGPRLDRGRCQITMEDAHTADLRGCPRCGRPQSRSAWDLHNGECARCGWVVEDLPERLAPYMLR